CFFFQAEDGIRDRNVTGVQTCALPISSWRVEVQLLRHLSGSAGGSDRANSRSVSRRSETSAVPPAQPASLRAERELLQGRGEPVERLVVAADLAGGDVGGDVAPHHGAVSDRDAVIDPGPLSDHHIITGAHIRSDLGAVHNAAAGTDGAALTDRGVRANRRVLADGRVLVHGTEEAD